MSDRENMRTGVYLGIAGVLFALTVIPFGGGAPAEMGQQGKRFFPEFDDFTKAVVLEVVDYANGEAQPFKVEYKDGVWRIPSRYNYPADAKDRIGKVAGTVMTLERTVLRSTKLEDQVKFGVVDPLDTEKGPEGRGRRITLRDADENVLASLIVSAPPKKAKDGKDDDEEKDSLGLPAGHRFVRAADETEIYSAKVDLPLETEFEKWIDTNVLDLAVADITTFTLARYKVDESQFPRLALKEGPTSVLRQNDSEWTVEGQTKEQQASVAAIDSLTEGLRALKIVDVRPFVNDMSSMVNVGIFPTREGVYGNEGELQVETKDGILYRLYFGEEAPGSKAKEPRRFLYIRAGLSAEILATITDAAKKKEIETKARRLALRFRDWYYVISATSFKDLRPPPEALVEKREEKEDGHGEGDGHGHGKEPKAEADPFEAMGFPPFVPGEEQTPHDDGGTGAPNDTGPPAPPEDPEQPEDPKQPEPEDPKQPDEGTKTPEKDKPDAPPPEQPKDDKSAEGKPGDAPKEGGE